MLLDELNHAGSCSYKHDMGVSPELERNQWLLTGASKGFWVAFDCLWDSSKASRQSCRHADAIPRKSLLIPSEQSVAAWTSPILSSDPFVVEESADPIADQSQRLRLRWI